MKRILTLICAVMFATALSFAQDTTPAQDTSQSTTATTTTHKDTAKSRRARHKKHQAKAAASENADASSGDLQAAGSETKDAAKSTGHGIKHGAKAVGNKTKEGYEASKEKVTGDKDTTTTTTTTDTTNPHLQNIAYQMGGSKKTDKPSASKSSAAAAAMGDKLDLNTASASDLEKLPGVAPAVAAKIIAERPYTAKNQLKTKGILTDKQYDAVKDQVIAHRATAGAAKSSAKAKAAASKS